MMGKKKANDRADQNFRSLKFFKSIGRELMALKRANSGKSPKGD